jgi:hypothetical protein
LYRKTTHSASLLLFRQLQPPHRDRKGGAMSYRISHMYNHTLLHTTTISGALNSSLYSLLEAHVRDCSTCTLIAILDFERSNQTNTMAPPRHKRGRSSTSSRASANLQKTEVTINVYDLLPVSLTSDSSYFYWEPTSSAHEDEAYCPNLVARHLTFDHLHHPRTKTKSNLTTSPLPYRPSSGPSDLPSTTPA